VVSLNRPPIEVDAIRSGWSLTLDGQPAQIVGRLQRFAVVRQIRNRRRQAQLDWQPVIRIVDHGDGAFLLHETSRESQRSHPHEN
jgi:hypothetical protein